MAENLCEAKLPLTPCTTYKDEIAPKGNKENLSKRYQLVAEEGRKKIVGYRHSHVHGGRYSLYVGAVSEEDFANYSCLAINTMGKEEGFIELRGARQRWKISCLTSSRIRGLIYASSLEHTIIGTHLFYVIWRKQAKITGATSGTGCGQKLYQAWTVWSSELNLGVKPRS